MKQNLNKYILLLALLSTVVFGKTGDFFKGKTSIKDPFSLRDPFKIPQKEETVESKVAKFRQGTGNYSNIVPLNSNISFKQLDIVGVLIGKDRRVIVKPKGKDANAPTFTISEGTKFPADNSTLKAILPGGVILVEKITNVYGEAEYLETVIPITK